MGLSRELLIKAAKSKLIELEAELQSLDTRISDLEWQYEQVGELTDEDLVDITNQRRKAIDKKKYIINDIATQRKVVLGED